MSYNMRLGLRSRPTERKKERSPSGDRPNMSELRILLLGNNASANNRVRNIILNKKVFGKKTLQPEAEALSERVEDRNITVISTTHLLRSKPSLQQITQKASALSVPEPHVIILVLQHYGFGKKKRDRLPSVLNCFGDQAMKRTMILTTDDEKLIAKHKPENEFIQQISAECEGGRLQLHHTQRSQILQKVDEIIHCSGFNESERDSLSQELRRSGQVTPLRIVLLGKSESESSRVGNSILGRSALDSEELSVERKLHQCSESVQDRHVRIIYSPQILQPHLSLHQSSQKVRKCVRLSAPGPHVFIIVVQYNDFTEEDRYRVMSVLREFSEKAMKRTIVITTDGKPYASMISSYFNAVHLLTKECGGGHLQLEESNPEWPSEIFKRADEILKENKKEYLICEHVEGTPVKAEQRFTDSVKERNDGEKLRKESDKVSEHFNEKTNLNLVLCGSDATLKVSVSQILHGQKITSSHQTECSEGVVRREVKMGGHLLSVVELPALSRLSEEEVMRQTLLSVTLCHPGVHAFIFIVHVGSLTDEDKEEVEQILKIFDSKERFFLLFTSDLSDEGFTTDYVKDSPESQRLIRRCGGQYRLMGLKEPENSRQIPDLLDYIENMKTEPYSPQMYVKAQEKRVRCETEKQNQKKLSEMEIKIKELEEKIHSEGAECSDYQKCLRIVLIGKTGNGKSATGNTILGREEFVSKARSDSVTTVCEKRVGEVDGRSVAVVDTPGLFDTTMKNDQRAEEIMKCVSLSSPGPHVFVIVLSVGRFTNEEADTVDLIKKIFGPKSAQFSIVLFTRGDDLKNESIQDYVRESRSAELKKLIRDCGDRFMAFNNRENQDRTQVIQLIKMIEEVKKINQGRYFTNSMFEEAEMNIKKRMEEIMKEREREIETQQEKLRVKYESETEELKKRLEEEKRKADDERKQRENEFREKEQKIIKDFEEKHKTEQQTREIEKQKLLEEEKQKKHAYNQKIEEMKREIENQRSEYEKQQREREEEDRKREEKYRHNQEQMKNEQECIIAELQIKQKEEIKKRDLEDKRRKDDEEEERQKWVKRIKEAESERKEIQEEIKRQQKEWEDAKKRQMREREDEEIRKKEKHKNVIREKQEELEKMRKRFEREREEERQKIEEEREKQRREREEKEREYKAKKQDMKRQLEQKLKEECERRKREEDERREEERKKWKKMIKDLKKEQEEEIKRREREEKERKEREEKKREEMKKAYEEKMKEMKKKHEDEARKQAEETNEFRERKEELQQKLEENQKEHNLFKELHQRLKEQKEKELKELQEEVKKLCETLQVQKEKEINELKNQAEALSKLLKEKKADKIELLQREVEKFCQSLQDQKGDKIQMLKEEADKLCKNLEEKKEQHFRDIQESGKLCVIL